MLNFVIPDLQLLFPKIEPALAQTLGNVVFVMEAVFAVFLVIAHWKLFEKIGEKPWKALIPFYNIYLLYKYTWNKKMFWTYLGTSMVFDILFKLSESTAQKNPESAWVGLLILIALPFGIIAAINAVLYSLRVAEAFGKKTPFGVGLVFLYSIFIMILGFDKSEYVRNNEISQAEGEELSDEPEKEII